MAVKFLQMNINLQIQEVKYIRNTCYGSQSTNNLQRSLPLGIHNPYAVAPPPRFYLGWSVWPRKYDRSDSMPLPRLGYERHCGLHLGCSLLDHLFVMSSHKERRPHDEELRSPTSSPMSEPLWDAQALGKLSDDYSPSQWLDCNLLRDQWTRTTQISSFQIPDPQKNYVR